MSRYESATAFKKVGTDALTRTPGDCVNADRRKDTINTEILITNKTLITTDYIVQWLDPNGADRNVVLSAEVLSTNLIFIILNIGNGIGTGEDLVVKNDAAATIAILGPGMAGIFSCDGTDWKWENNSGVYYDNFLENIAVGYQTLYSNNWGYENTAIGYQSLYSNYGGYSNTTVGYKSSYSNTNGIDNTALGYKSLYSNTTGWDNTAIGYRALMDNIGGRDNTAVGEDALGYNTTGDYNTAIGSEALEDNISGDDNTAIGADSLQRNTTGSRNTAVGEVALGLNSTGLRNIAVGYYAGYYELGSDAFYINNQDRTTTANEKLTSIIYGIMAAAVTDQKLTFNALVTMAGGQSVSKIDAGAADYNPSIPTSDHIITVDTTAAARAVTISAEDKATGSATSPRIFIIKDIAGNAGTNNITVSLETAGTIDGATTAVINANYNSITLMVDGTNGYVI